MMATHTLSEHRACGLVEITRHSFRRRRIGTPNFARGFGHWPKSGDDGPYRMLRIERSNRWNICRYPAPETIANSWWSCPAD